MVRLSKVPFVTLLLVLLGSQVKSDAYDHRYSIGDIVPMYYWERYSYYDFPICSPVVDVTDDMEIDVDFTYSVKWWEIEDERLNDYATSSILPYHICAHVHSIANSCFTIIIVIICLVIFYMRFLHKDISRYACDVEDNQEQKGWKNIHGDVFRFPKHKSLLSAALGSGTQLLAMMVAILILGVFQPYFQGVFLKRLVIVYAVTSVVSGYTSASFYHQLKGTTWIMNGGGGDTIIFYIFPLLDSLFEELITQDEDGLSVWFFWIKK
ncbi:hypothetical protein L1987_61622 [Smallanthus sonchifolius]|uniref:Uncharacterized protein n=1 Tax=Smallanthus sonchifolius TaxID=185202 RepID=A0ACB9C8F9_9ASTR|nr:hypothetical protein L1987_61622 [Smallanthus sonchifolius]